jgi:hypothetical protein
MVSKILSIIDSCKTAEQIQTCNAWLQIIEISHDDKLACLGSMQLKLKQLADTGWAKITNENRFPADDEQRD